MIPTIRHWLARIASHPKAYFAYFILVFVLPMVFIFAVMKLLAWLSSPADPMVYGMRRTTHNQRLYDAAKNK